MIERSTIHRLGRRGAAPGKIEDAVGGPVEGDGFFRVAIADGATESMGAAPWAFALATRCAQQGTADAIPLAREEFTAIRSLMTSALPWYTEEKLVEGAHATVLAAEVRDDGSFAAEAVGDCVLLHLRSEELVRSWPIDDPAAFGSTPALVSSIPDSPVPDIQRLQGEWTQGDVILLATDALAAHLLEHGTAEAVGLDDAGFERFVKGARAAGMRNDDVTLVELHL